MPFLYNRTQPPSQSPSLILHKSLLRSSALFSLDHCFHPEKSMEKIFTGTDYHIQARIALSSAS